MLSFNNTNTTRIWPLTEESSKLCLRGDKETFKEYAQRFIQKSAQVRPALEEREVTDLFFETLSPFYSEKMCVVATRKFTDIVDT